MLLVFHLCCFGCFYLNVVIRICVTLWSKHREKKHWLVFFYVWNKCRDNQKKSFLRQLNRDMHVYKYAEREQFLALEYIDFFMFFVFHWAGKITCLNTFFLVNNPCKTMTLIEQKCGFYPWLFTTKKTRNTIEIVAILCGMFLWVVDFAKAHKCSTLASESVSTNIFHINDPHLVFYMQIE